MNFSRKIVCEGLRTSLTYLVIKAYCINVIVHLKHVLLINTIYLKVRSIVQIKTINLFLACLLTVVIKENCIFYCEGNNH